MNEETKYTIIQFNGLPCVVNCRDLTLKTGSQYAPFSHLSSANTALAQIEKDNIKFEGFETLTYEPKGQQ